MRVFKDIFNENSTPMIILDIDNNNFKYNKEYKHLFGHY